MTLENKFENMAGTKEELIEKATILHEAFKKSGEKIIEVDPEELDAKFRKMAREIPDEAIRNNIAKTIDILKKENVSTERMLELVEDAVRLNLDHYFDLREYVKMPRKELSKYRLSLMISVIADRKSIEIIDLKKIARVAFDLNGLKAMNDLGGHDKGDEGLRIFSEILKNGKTTKWIKDKGLEAIPSSEGGDEFGLIISGVNSGIFIDDTILKEIKKRYVEEIISTPADHLVDIRNEVVQERLLKKGFDQNDLDKMIKGDFRFKISSSIGITRLDETLTNINISAKENYTAMARRIVGAMFKEADDRAIANKERFKSELEYSSDFNERALFDMYSRLDKETIRLKRLVNKLEQALIDRGATQEEISLIKKENVLFSFPAST